MLPEMDDNGLLIDANSWNESVALELAKHNDIQKLTADHWTIIYALRDHYARYKAPPAMNLVCTSKGRDWHWAHDLFHTCLNAWRIAGLPDPGEEAETYLSAM